MNRCRRLQNSPSQTRRWPPASPSDEPRRRLAHDRPARARRRAQAMIGRPTFRATGITAYLEAGGTIENAQAMAAHESTRTTRLYDRAADEITVDKGREDPNLISALQPHNLSAATTHVPAAASICRL